MHIKRFEAPTMIEAVRKVKATLGPDALILSSRRVRKDGGVFGMFGRATVEITAAVDRDTRKASRLAAGRKREREEWQGVREAKAMIDPLEAELRTLRRRVDAMPRTPEDRELRAELGELRRSLADRGPASPLRGSDARFVSRLLEWGLAPRHAFAIGAEAAAHSGEEKTAQDQSLRAVLDARLDACLAPPREDDPARACLFVGPTGVGKTTSLAKLAAHEEDREDRAAVVTTDTFRIGAVEQLQTYSGLLGVPFEVVTNESDLSQTLERHRGRRVFVDTAGRGKRDVDAIGELAAYRRSLGNRGHVELVLSATTQDADLRAAWRRFSVLRPDSLLITKLDESESLASIANFLLDGEAPPVRWVSVGQRVPEDITVPEPSLLREGLLAGGIA